MLKAKLRDLMLKNRINKLNKSAMMSEEKGFTLIEVLVAVVLVAIIGAGIFVGIQSMTKIQVDTNTQETAKDIAASNMDWIMSQPYASNYNLDNVPSPLSAYSSAYEAQLVTPVPLEMTEQQITIKVLFNNKVIYTLTDIRMDY